jgi:hypothetical protein
LTEVNKQAAGLTAAISGGISVVNVILLFALGRLTDLRAGPTLMLSTAVEAVALVLALGPILNRGNSGARLPTHHQVALSLAICVFLLLGLFYLGAGISGEL